jgi:predicted TIM-barrel fold metal-dependent hydrolase
MTPIVDFHVHLRQGTPGTTDPEQRGISAQMVVASAQQAGIDLSVVCPVQYLADEYPGANAEIASAVRAYPMHLIGLGRVNPGHPQAADQVRQAVEELGLRGLKLHHACDWFEVEHEVVERIVRQCGALRIPVLFHSPGVVGPLLRVSERAPETTLVLGHMGGDSAGMRQCLDGAARLPNVWLETSTAQDLDLLQQAAASFPERLLFGTDSIAGPERRRELAKVSGLSVAASTRSAILGANALRLLAPASPGRPDWPAYPSGPAPDQEFV